jgi:hypothetical protein
VPEHIFAEIDGVLEGSGILTELRFPYYEPLMPYIEAAVLY